MVLELTTAALTAKLIGQLALSKFYKYKKKTNALLYEVKHFTVIIPAYNEEIGICKTVKSSIVAAKLTGKPFEILIIDDGSSDDTGIIAHELANMYSCVGVIIQENNGKSFALNSGLLECVTDVFITVDADCEVDTQAFVKLITKLEQTGSAAVSGLVKVGVQNNNILTAFQSLEYTFGQKVEKQFLAQFNGVAVIPGALGAFRRDWIEYCGFYPSRTLTEDMHLTLIILSQNAKIEFEESAIVRTEPPVNLSDLIKQRIRWQTGTLQTLMITKMNKYNRFSLVYIWFMSIILLPLPFLSMWLVATQTTVNIILLIVVFTVVETVVLVIADEKFKLIHMLAPIQRIFQYFFNAYIFICALKKIAKKDFKWNKLSRLGVG